VEASSGKTQRRRLNRGDRQANSALYTIVIARLRGNTRTRSYVERRVTESKTRREAIRCLKRYAPARSTKACSHRGGNLPHQPPPVDIHRGIKLAVRYEATVTIAVINEWF
jgi:hypothetical protein